MRCFKMIQLLLHCLTGKSARSNCDENALAVENIAANTLQKKTVTKQTFKLQGGAPHAMDTQQKTPKAFVKSW